MIDKAFQHNPVSTIILAIIIVALLMTIFSIRNYFNMKAAKVELEATLDVKKYEWVVGETNPANSKLDPSHIRMEATTRLFELIDAMVANEVASILFTYSLTNKEYAIQKLDIDIREGAKNILDGLDKETLLERNLIVTSDYIATYTMRVMTQELIVRSKEYNSQLRQASTTVE